MARMRLAVADPRGVISFHDHVPADHRLIGCGSVRQLRDAVRRTAERGHDNQSLIVPGADADLDQGVVRLRHRLRQTLRPVPDLWRARVGHPPTQVELPVWKLLREADAPMTVRELRNITGLRAVSINTRLARWFAAGLVQRTDDPHRRYSLAPGKHPSVPPRVDQNGTIIPRTPTAIERLWRAIRTLTRHGPFDNPILMMAAGASDRAAINLTNVLHRAGYLRQVSRGNGPLGTYSTYLLIRDTGPRPPSIKHYTEDGKLRRFLVDGNTGARIDVSPASVSLKKKAKRPLSDGGVC